mgnify:CR=1 FL=1
MNKKKFSIVVIVLLIAVGAMYAYCEYNRKPASMADVTSDFSVNTTNLLAAFEKDEAAANKKYLDKVLEVQGALKEVTADDKGFYTVVLGDDASLSSVRCSIDSLYSAHASSLKAGGLVKVKGVCTGFMKDELVGSDVTLVRCAIIEK